MSGNIDSEQWQNFNERLSYWISKQGFWFQLRHSLPRGGRKGGGMFHFMHLTLRLLIFLTVVGAGWVGVVKLTGKENFSDAVSESLQEKFAANEIETKGISREKGKFSIARLAMIADQKSFYRGLELSNLICQRDFFVDFGKTWKPGIVEISKVNLALRAGADTNESAQAIGDVLFQEMGQMQPDAIYVQNMTIRWGYTERSRGSISGSSMKAVPIHDGWRLSFRGGTLSQNWLKRLYIEKLDVVISRQGIRFEEASFTKDGGTLVLEDFEIVAGQRPKISGNMKMQNLNISNMLPVVTRAYAEGKISGEFKIEGSTNTSEGVRFNGTVKLEEGDVITLRERIPLLRALTVVDSSNNYRRVDFKIGSFQLETKDEGMMISKVNLFAGDTLSLTGDMFVRKPKSDEELVLDDGSEFFGEIVKGDDQVDDIDISLREAGEAFYSSASGFQNEADDSLFGKLAVLGENRRMREYESEKLTRSYRYEGSFQITLMKTAFDRAPELKAAFPAAMDSGRIPMNVPIQGVLYELTESVANQIYEKGRR